MAVAAPLLRAIFSNDKPGCGCFVGQEDQHWRITQYCYLSISNQGAPSPSQPIRFGLGLGGGGYGKYLQVTSYLLEAGSPESGLSLINTDS